MSPSEPTPDVIERRLALQRDLLAELDRLLPLDADRLAAEPITRAAVERIMQAVVDLALDVNAHVAASVLGQAPATGRESFDLMVSVGAIDVALADALKPSVGLRNVLVHMYADIDVGLIADAASEFSRRFAEYRQQVARWLLDQA